MGLDLDINIKNIKNVSNISIKNINEISIGKNNVELEYRLNMIDITNEQSYFEQNDLYSPVFLLSFGLWKGFNDSIFMIDNKNGQIIFKELNHFDDSIEIHKELLREEKQALLLDINNGIDFCKKEIQDEDSYYVIYGLTVFQMIKEVIESPNSTLIAFYN